MWGGQGPKIHPVKWVKGEEDSWIGKGNILGFTPILRGQKAAPGNRDLEGSFWGQTLFWLSFRKKWASGLPWRSSELPVLEVCKQRLVWRYMIRKTLLNALCSRQKLLDLPGGGKG